MRSVAVMGVAIVIGGVAVEGAWPVTPSETTRAATEPAYSMKWMDDASAVSVTFLGPEMDLAKLRAAGTAAALLPAEAERAAKGERVRLPEGFVFVPGEKGDQYYLRVEMKVTEENRKRLGLMIERMSASGYRVDAALNKVMEPKRPATTRGK